MSMGTTYSYKWNCFQNVFLGGKKKCVQAIVVGCCGGGLSLKKKKILESD